MNQIRLAAQSARAEPHQTLLEFDHVIIANAVHHDEVHDLYVALTRARKTITILSTKTDLDRPVVAVGPGIGQGREIDAVVLLVGQAHHADSARVDDIADRHAVAHPELADLPADGSHLSDELVAGHEREGATLLDRGVQRVQITVADPAERDPYGYVVGSEVPSLERHPLQRPVRSARPQSCHLHTDQLSSTTDWLVTTPSSTATSATRGPCSTRSSPLM